MRNKLRVLMITLMAGGTMFAQGRMPIEREGGYRQAPPKYEQRYEQRDEQRDRDDRGGDRDRRDRDERREQANDRERNRRDDFRR